MENIFWIVVCVIQFVVIIYFIGIAISANKEIKEQSEIIEIQDRRIQTSIENYNLALEREMMLIDELDNKDKVKIKL